MWWKSTTDSLLLQIPIKNTNFAAGTVRTVPAANSYTYHTMAQKPSIPKGTRDFTAEEMARRNYIFDTIRDVFRLYGYRQIDRKSVV